MKTTIHERLRKARKTSGLSQSELAARVKVKPPLISHFENGKRAPSLLSLRRLADALDVSIDYLLGRTANPAGQTAEPIGDTPLAEIHRRMKDWDRTTQENAVRLLVSYFQQRKP